MAGNTVVDAIRSVATDTRVYMAMLMGARLESGWNPNAVGDNGHSHGIFQINLPFHPSMNVASARDPVQASRYMLPAYKAGVDRVSPAMWNSDPALAAATAAFYAERPKVMYPTSRVRAAWPAVQSALGSGQPGAVGSGLGVGAGTETGAPDSLRAPTDIPVVGDFLKWAEHTFGDIVNRLYVVLVVGVGGVMVLTGFYLLMRETTRIAEMGSTTKSAVTKVVTLGAR